MMRFNILLIATRAEPTFGPDITVTTMAPADLDQNAISRDFDAVIVAEENASVLTSLRANLWLAPLPIFAISPLVAAHPLCDGLVPADLATVLNTVKSRAREYSDKLDGTVERTVLAYLWALETRRLTPTIHLDQPQIYAYDFLTGLGVDHPSRWLADAERTGLIAPDKVVDRTRNCGNCGGAHLNYVDRCAHCDGLEVFAEQAIHCFTCGLIAEEGHYARGERLVCPKCQTALKHIGTDYDRPIERLRCGDCGERFNDARVKATCLECETVNAQDALRSQTYRSYQIGPAGETLIRLGRQPADIVQPFGEALGKDQFLWTLSWLNAVAETSNNTAALAKVSVGRRPSDNDQDKAEIASLRAQIGTLLSPSEIIHFYDPETILLLLPQDGSNRLQTIANDLEGISSSHMSGDVELIIQSVHLPQPKIASDAPHWLEQFAGPNK